MSTSWEFGILVHMLGKGCQHDQLPLETLGVESIMDFSEHHKHVTGFQCWDNTLYDLVESHMRKPASRFLQTLYLLSIWPRYVSLLTTEINPDYTYTHMQNPIYSESQKPKLILKILEISIFYFIAFRILIMLILNSLSAISNLYVLIESYSNGLLFGVPGSFLLKLRHIVQDNSEVNKPLVWNFMLI